jgi:hypothetical protein
MCSEQRSGSRSPADTAAVLAARVCRVTVVERRDGMVDTAGSGRVVDPPHPYPKQVVVDDVRGDRRPTRTRSRGRGSI